MDQATPVQELKPFKRLLNDSQRVGLCQQRAVEHFWQGLPKHHAADKIRMVILGIETRLKDANHMRLLDSLGFSDLRMERSGILRAPLTIAPNQIAAHHDGRTTLFLLTFINHAFRSLGDKFMDVESR